MLGSASANVEFDIARTICSSRLTPAIHGTCPRHPASVRNRRVSLTPVRPDEGLQTKPGAAAPARDAGTRLRAPIPDVDGPNCAAGRSQALGGPPSITRRAGWLSTIGTL